MRRFKNWIVKVLGGYTNEEVGNFEVQVSCAKKDDYAAEMLAAHCLAEMIWEDQCCHMIYNGDNVLTMRMRVLKNG